MRTLHRQAASAWLRGEGADALLAAERLCRAAPAIPGAWQVLEMVATTAGDARLAARAHRRRERLEADDA